MNIWKDTVIDELVCCGVYSAEHEDNPRKALNDAINWNVDVALDPSVSKQMRDALKVAVQYGIAEFLERTGQYVTNDASRKALLKAERERCIKIIEAYQVPVGNSSAGELACDWTMEALREIRDDIRALGDE